jgi:hypothetical protein
MALLVLLSLSPGCLPSELSPDVTSRDFTDADSAAQHNNFELWHSTAMPKMHGPFTTPCTRELGGLLPAANGEFVLSKRAAALAGQCGVNLAANTTCSTHRPLVRGQGIVAQTPDQFLRGVQDTRAGIIHFLREEHSVFTKELWQSSLCVPTTYGPRVMVTLAGKEHALPVRVRGTGMCSAQVGVQGTFHVVVELPASLGSAAPLPSSPFPVAAEARLVGPSIVAASPTYHDDGKGCRAADGASRACSRRLSVAFSYTVHEPGAYLLEVMLLHVAAKDMLHLAYRGGVTIRTGEGGGEPPRGEPAAAGGGSGGRATPLSGKRPLEPPPRDKAAKKPLCVRGDEPGRWVRKPYGEGGGSGGAHSRPPPLYNDALYYNRGYWWEPYNCRYRAFSPVEIDRCFRKHGWTNFGFSGDSLGREPMSNLIQALQGDDAMMLDGRQYKVSSSGQMAVAFHLNGSKARGGRASAGEGAAASAAASHSIQTTWNPSTVQMYRLSAFLFSPFPVQRFGQLTDRRASVSSVVAAMKDQTSVAFRACQAAKLPCVFLSNPAVHRGVRSREIAAAVEAAARYAESLGMPVLDAHGPSAARWFATWDGVHYTFSARVQDYPDKPFAWQWQGGVSHTNLIVYLNVLCNNEWPIRNSASPFPTLRPHRSA